MRFVAIPFAALCVAAAVAAPAGEKLVLPPTIYAVEGRECVIYFNNLVRKDLSDEVVEVVCDGGVQQNERFVFTPDRAGATPLTIVLRDPADWSELDRAQATVKAADAGAGGTLRVMVLGDSLVESNLITGGLLELAADDPLELELIGGRGDGKNRHEGRSGWTVRNYTIGGVYSFAVKEGDLSGLKTGADLAGDNAKFRLMRTEKSDDGSPVLVCSLESGSPPEKSVGALTRRDGGKIDFCSVRREHLNPLWRNGKVDFPAMVEQEGLPAPDWVIVQLGTNDVLRQVDDEREKAALKGIFRNLDTLISSARRTGAKVGLMIIPPPAATQDAFGANYGTARNRARVKRNCLIWAEELIAKYADREPEGIFLIPSNTALDTVNGFPRHPETGRQSNGVHPAPAGYRQLAEALWFFLKNQAEKQTTIPGGSR